MAWTVYLPGEGDKWCFERSLMMVTRVTRSSGRKQNLKKKLLWLLLGDKPCFIRKKKLNKEHLESSE